MRWPHGNTSPGRPIWCSRPLPGEPTSLSVLSVSIKTIG